MIKRIEVGPRYSSAVIHGGKVYLSGYVPENSAGQSIAAQTLDVLTQIEETLREAGSNKSRILKANIYLADITTIGEMNGVWDKWVVPNETPARATVEAKLADPSWGVEIMIEAAI
ncbi:MAG: RidA family protein [Burkholderiales bacterium]|nr:MAG: RidA family protein [Burkholderiales bacterium]